MPLLREGNPLGLLGPHPVASGARASHDAKTASERRLRLGQEVLDGLAVDAGKGLELDDVHPTITGLTTRDEGLGLAKPARGLALVEPGIGPGLDQLRQEPPVGG